MSEKKRKSHAGDEGRPAKKQVTATNPTVTVNYIAGSPAARPVIGRHPSLKFWMLLMFSASTPGVTLPKPLNFESFAKRDGTNQELLLHSSNHPMIDYTATQDTDLTGKYLKHYVAVYDPASGQMQVTEAKKMTVRSTVRQREPNQEEGDPPEMIPTTNYSARAALTHAFGTKKSKKTVQSNAENRLFSQGADNSNSPVTKALLSMMPAREVADIVTDSPESFIQANKPLPIPDLTTNDITRFYPLSSLVFPAPVSETLAKMPVEEWQARVRNKQPVECQSRFVSIASNHVVKAANANPDDVDVLLTLQILRYVLVLVELVRKLPNIPSERRLPSPEKWKLWFSGSIPQPLLQKVMEKFCPNGTGPSKANVTLLRTTILALTLHIPPPSGKSGSGVLVALPHDIQQDLRLLPEEVRHLYKELGCKYEAATEAELDLWGLRKKVKTKEVGPAMRVAKLKFPVEFPRLRRGQPMTMKRR